MKIVVSATSYFPEEPGGAARLAYDLASECVRLGHEVWMVSQARDLTAPTYVVEQGLHVLRYRLASANGLDVLRHIRHINATMALLRQHVGAAPDVIHGHDLFSYVAALRLYRSGCPRTCYSIHSPATDELAFAWKGQGARGSVKQVLGQPVIRYYERQALKRSSALAAESSFTRSRIQTQYGRPLSDRIQIIPGWIDHTRFAILSAEQSQQARQRLGWPQDRPVFFVLRRLDGRMGLDRLLHAVAELKASGHDAFIAIAGHGPERQPLEDLRQQLGLQSNVEFMGRLPDELLPLAYGACDASIIPTRALECFGIIALEAMGAGRPVLVTPVGSLPEVVGAFEPQWVAAGNQAEHIAAILRAYLQKALPVHDPRTIACHVSGRYGFSQAFQEYRQLLGI